jgi:hypothetical protein
LQVQTGLLVTGREWCDFVSYSAGLPMVTLRVWADSELQGAIVDAASAFEERLAVKLAEYRVAMGSTMRLLPTVRRVVAEMHL